MPKSELSWTNISRSDLASPACQEAWDMYVTAKAELEKYLAVQAIEDGVANEGDTFKFSYTRWAQGTIGMAIDTPAKSQRSGFGGLKRPVDARERETEKLADYLAHRQAQGRRF
jgi:hypothetical protein